METGIAVGAANVVSFVIGQQIMSHAISDATNTIYTSIGRIFYYSSFVDQLLLELDLTQKLKSMELAIKELHSSIALHPSVQSCCESIHEMTLFIREDLKQIEEKIMYHRTKWLNRVRSIGIHEEIKHLVTHSKLLDNRYDLLVKTIGLCTKSHRHLKRYPIEEHKKCTNIDLPL